HPEFSPRRFPLDLESLESGGDGIRVEGHIGDGRDTTGSGSRRGGLKSLPLRSSGFVDVHVAVNQSGHYHVIAKIFTRHRHLAIADDDTVDGTTVDYYRRLDHT